MPPSSLAQLNAISKMLYQDGAEEIGITETPAIGMMRKTSDFYGESKAFTSRFSKTPGKSRTFATARLRAGPSQYARWIVTRGNDFVHVQIGVSPYEALGNNKGAQVAYVEDECKSAYDACMQRLERNVFRNAGGAITQVASGGATDTITVSEPSALISVDLNDYLESSTDDGTGGAGVDAGGAKQVNSINRIAGTLYTDTTAAWNTGGGFADNSYIFLQGDYGLALGGVPTFVRPTTPVAGTTVYGLDISVDERLNGIRYVASSGSPDGSITRAFRNAATRCHHHGGTPDKIFMNTLDFGEYVNDLGNAAQYVTVPGQGLAGKKLDVGYAGVRIMMPYGPVTVHPNRYVQRYNAWGLDYKDVSFEGLKETPRWMDIDGGGKWFRMASDDLHAVEGYLYYEGQFVVRNPGNHFHCDLSNLFT